MMPGTQATANIPASKMAPATGIYVVMHREPAHAQPHEVLIPAGSILPRCNECEDVRFSLRSYAPQPLDECEFFRTLEWRAPTMTQQKLNEWMIEAETRARARDEILLACPVGACQWSTESIKGAAIELRRHLVTSH